MGRKLGTVSLWGELGPHVTQCSWGWGLPQYQVAPWSMQPFGHNTWAKTGGCCAPFGGERSSHLTQCRLGRGLDYLPTKWNLNPSSHLSTTDMDWKLGLFPFFWWGGAWSPFKTMWLGPRPTSMPSLFFSHRTVLPQYTNVTDRQRSDSIGRTILQTVTQKHRNMIPWNNE